MKKMKFGWITLVAVMIFMPVVQSCDDFFDSDNPLQDAEKVTIATILPVSDDENEDEFYFLLDGGQKLYPGDLSSISRNYKWVNGQRAFVYCDLLDEKIEGYDYNGKIIHIENILTKGVIPMTEETADSIGDNKINVNYAGYGGDHLNIEFQFLGTRNPSKLHMVNLVRNDINGVHEDGDYLVLEFRHNAHNDYPEELLTGIVSFKPPFTKSEIDKPFKGIKLRVNTIYEGVQYVTVNFEQNTGRSYSSSITQEIN